MDSQMKQLFASLKELTPYANMVAKSDISFLRMEPEASGSLDRCGEQLMKFVSDLVTTTSDIDSQPPVDVESFFESWEMFAEANDNLLEQADTYLDEYSGAKVKDNIAVRQSTIRRQKPFLVRQHAEKHSSSIPRPQLQWRDPIQNFNNSFAPKLKRKPHAQMNLHDSLLNCSEHAVRFPHPYAFEICNLKYPASIFEQVVPHMPYPLETKNPVWVNTVDELKSMTRELITSSAIAVDLEHHDYRSYRGFVCLMQISSRSKDWVIDTLALHDEMEILNEIFTNPTIIKVMHGASLDVMWLQQDFGIYVVGLFDTFHACSVLNFPKKGLGYLAEKYVNFKSDKKYQVADWRMRPLTQEMLSYAQSDTHFLLYIFDCLKNELLDHGRAGMSEVLEASQRVALQRYEHQQVDVENGKSNGSWQGFLRRFRTKFAQPEIQKPIFIALYLWRDHAARLEDEGLQYVLPNHDLINLTNVMPTDVLGVLKACRPTPPLITKYAEEIAALIRSEINERNKTAQTDPLESKNASMAHGQSKTANIEHTQNNSVNIEHAQSNVVDMEHVQTNSTESEQRPKKPVFGDSQNNLQLILLKAEESVFWGGVLDTRPVRNKEAKIDTVANHLNLIVPLPKLSADVYENVNNRKSTNVQPQDPGALAEIPFVRRKRKQDLGEEIVIVKKAQVNLDRMEQRTVATEKQHFDYQNAPPVYKSASNGNEEKKDVKNRFNPYRQPDNRTAHSERKTMHYRGPTTGKSGTFKAR